MEHYNNINDLVRWEKLTEGSNPSLSAIAEHP
jgi:hypothetical protein